jgi:uncharacterized protein
MSTDIWILIAVMVLSLAGIIGCIAPGLPGPPLNYAALLLVQYQYKPFTTTFIIIWTVIIVLTAVMDYFVPVWFAKKYGASKYGVWGSIVGMVVGIFFTPVGMVLGMLIGAIVGEMMGGSDSVTAVKSGIATFFGTMLSIGLKLVVSVVISVYLFMELTKVKFDF